MNHPTPSIQSRLPDVGLTIFSTISALAEQHQAINLGQGFPDFECDPKLIEAVTDAMRAGHNQYPPMPGVPVLREAVAAKIRACYGHTYDPGTEITITAGATQAILTIILAVVMPGEEVIVLDPSYDDYDPAIRMAGGVPVRVPLTPGNFKPDVERIAAALSDRTRLLIINTPHNPTGAILDADDMRQLEALLAPTNVLLLSDEVYEHMVYDGGQHQSASRFPALAARAFVVSSFGKTFHVTGWKVGTVAAPAPLMAEFRKIHQYNVFTVHSATQVGIAHYLQDPRPYQELPAFYQHKRDLFRAGLASTRFRLLDCHGTYFQTVDYSAISDLSDGEFCEWLIRDVGVAAIPLSPFYGDGFDQGVIRFCFAKKEETLNAALARLQAL